MSQHHLRRYNLNSTKRRKMRQRVAERDGWICQICFKPINRLASFREPDSLTMDHIIEASDGGPFVLENLRAAHRSCNEDRSRVAA